MKKIYLAILVLCIVALSLVPVMSYAAVEIPEPNGDFACDFANVLSSSTKESIEEYNASLEQKCGAQIVVVTVDFIGDAEIEDFAYAMFNKWGIGSADKNNGVLLLLAIGDDNYWCVQGSGLERNLSSASIKTILDEYLEPDFAIANYDSGVKKTFSALLSRVADIYDVTIDKGDSSFDYNDYYSDDKDRDENGASFFEILSSIFVIAFIIMCFAGGRGGGCLRTLCCCLSCSDCCDGPNVPRGGGGSHVSGFGRGSGRSSGRGFGGGFSGGGGSTRGGGAGRR